MENLVEDVAALNQINDLTASLHCPHGQLEEVVREMLSSVNKQLAERQTSDSQLSYLELTLNTQWVTTSQAFLSDVMTAWQWNRISNHFHSQVFSRKTLFCSVLSCFNPNTWCLCLTWCGLEDNIKVYPSNKLDGRIWIEYFPLE